MFHRQARKERYRPLTFLALLGALWSAAVLGPAPAPAQDAPCAGAETLLPGSVLRHDPAPSSAPIEPGPRADLVRVPVPEPGVLELYLSAGARATAPRLSFLGTGCKSPAGEGTSWVLIRETPRELHLRIREPGDFFAAVSSEDPKVPLAEYALHVTFAAERSVPDEVVTLTDDPPSDCSVDDLPTFSPEPFADSRFVVLERHSFTKDVDPKDDDDMSGLTAESGVLLVESPAAALDAALHEGRDCGLAQRVAEGALDGPGTFIAAPVHAGDKRLVLRPRSAFDAQYQVWVRHFALCMDSVDDHPDRPLCATVLSPGDTATGIVDSADDEDHFTFTVAGQETVAIGFAGRNGVRAVLYDQNGQRLDAWDGGRLVRTLGRGRFYVLVTGVDGWPGDYTVRLGSIP